MPKRQPKEAPEVTIGNLEREINNLELRCVDLIGFRDTWQRKYHEAVTRIDELTAQHGIKDGLLQEQREQYSELEDAYTRLSGWQDCAREMLASDRDAWPK